MTTELILKCSKDKKGIITPGEAEALSKKTGGFCYFKVDKKNIIAFTDLEDLREFEMPSGCSHVASILPRHSEKSLYKTLTDYRLAALSSYKIITDLEKFNNSPIDNKNTDEV